jgi:hypothetical protein
VRSSGLGVRSSGLGVRSSGLGVRSFLLIVRQLLLTAPLLLAPSAGGAQELVPVPELRARVTDLTGTLEASQAGALEAKLTALEDETGTQIAVLIVPTVRPPRAGSSTRPYSRISGPVTCTVVWPRAWTG